MTSERLAFAHLQNLSATEVRSVDRFPNTVSTVRSAHDELTTKIRRLAIAAVVLLTFLNAADTVTTRLLLTHAPRGAVEANPLAGLLLASGSLLLVKFVIIAALGVAVLWDRPRLGLTVGLWAACGLYTTAVLSNILILRLV